LRSPHSRRVGGSHARSRLDDLAAPAADVDDVGLDQDRPAAAHAEEREQALLGLGEDGQGDAAGSLDLDDDPGCVRRPAERLGPDEGDGARTERAGPLHLADEGLDEGRPELASEPTTLGGLAEPEKDGLVGQHADPFRSEAGDEEVDRVRARVGGRDDHGSRSGGPHPPRGCVVRRRGLATGGCHGTGS